MDTKLIEKEYADLKEAFETGEIEAEAFQAAVDDLRTQDDYGRYWTIGVESGQWYYFDGVSWIQADPREADSLPFVDENGVYWMLGQESGEWYYYDGENWVNPEINGVDLDAYATPAEEYYQDSEGRFWAIGKKSGEWYYYDEGGWRRASEIPTGVSSEQAVPQQPYYPEQTQPAPSSPPPNSVPFQPVQPAPGYLQGYPSTGYEATQAVRPQSTYPPSSSPAGSPQPQQPSAPQSVDPYGYTQPVPPQGQPQQPPGQPTGYSQPTSPEAPSPQVPAGKPEPGVWFYYDGEQWLRYQEDPEGRVQEAEAGADTGLAEEEAYFADEEYFDEVDELYEEGKVVEIEDLDEFVEVVEVQEEDIIDLEEGEALVDAEFQVEVLRPGEKASSQTTPLEVVSTSASASEAAAAVETPAAAQTAKPQPQASGLPKVSPQPQKDKAEFSARAVPAWFWTSLGGVIILIATAVLLISIRYGLNNQQETASIAAVTPTLSAGVPPTTPTVGPTPPPTATIPPTATPVPLNTYDSDYFGFSIEYPSGWVYRENDDLVIFAPSTRSLDNTNLNGAVLWISFTEDADLTGLLASELERFSPISETLNEGSMEIGSQSWASAQIRFNSTELGGEAIALIASTVRDDVGYSLVAVAPATEWEDFVTLFQYPVNSFAFLKGEGRALAEAPTPVPQAKEEAGAGEGSTGGDVERPTPQPTSTATTTATSETVPPTPTIYTVVSGDTLGGISVKFDVAIDDLVEANNLESDRVVLQIGQKLIIPQEGVAIAAVTATATSTSTPQTSTATPGEEERSAEQPPAEENTPAPTGDESTATPTEAAPTPTPVPTTPPPPTPEPVKEVTLSGRIVYPAYSTDINSFNVWTTRVDGSNSQIIAGNASQPQFSPDGSLFAYRSWEPSHRGIYFVDFTTGRQELLTHFIEDGLPTWSPDKTLVFSSRREGDRLPRLYRVEQRPETDFSLGFLAEYPDTLPDGHLVVRGCTISGECGLWKLLPDGSGEVKISSDTSDTAPAANPLGGRIALMSFDRDGAGNWEIWTINSDGSDPKRLTENRANDGLPTWSPDGRSIAFVSDRGGVWAIWVMNSDGSNQRKLFDMPSPPDGQVLHDVPNSRGWLEERIDWIP